MSHKSQLHASSVLYTRCNVYTYVQFSSCVLDRAAGRRHDGDGDEERNPLWTRFKSNLKTFEIINNVNRTGAQQAHKAHFKTNLICKRFLSSNLQKSVHKKISNET